MWVVVNKRDKHENNNFPSHFPRLSLTSSQTPLLLSCYHCKVTLHPSPFREEASGAKGVFRGYDQGLVVSLCPSFLLIPFFSMYVIHRLQGISALL